MTVDTGMMTSDVPLITKHGRHSGVHCVDCNVITTRAGALSVGAGGSYRAKHYVRP